MMRYLWGDMKRNVTKVEIPEGFEVGEPILRSALCKGDIVRLESTPAISYAGVSGRAIDRIGPKNVLICVPWDRYTNDGIVRIIMKHRIPKEVITHVCRGTRIHEVL